MKKINLDFSECMHAEDLEETLTEAFGLPRGGDVFDGLSDFFMENQNKSLYIEITGTVGFLPRDHEYFVFTEKMFAFFKTINEKFPNAFATQVLSLDFSGCEDLDDVYRLMKEAFVFPDYFGENANALWDCLRDFPDWPLLVSISGLSNIMNKHKYYQQQIQIILEVFDDVHQKIPEIEFLILS